MTLFQGGFGRLFVSFIHSINTFFRLSGSGCVCAFLYSSRLIFLFPFHFINNITEIGQCCKAFHSHNCSSGLCNRLLGNAHLYLLLLFSC